jgi:TRAP-type C4-dicarboxylate transport system permease small subunit
MLAIFILSSLAYTHQKKGHVMVSMIVSRLPERWQLILGAFTTILSLFVMAILIWQGWVTGIEERTVSDMLRIPERPFRLLVPVAGLLLFLELLIDLTRIGQKLFMRQ